MSPTLLLVHGGGHGNPIYLTEFREQLKKYGISSAAYRAPSESGPPTPGRAMYDDALYWREKIGTLVDAGEDVVILAHSIGSVVATEASQGLTKAERQAKGLHGGVVHLIFLAAYLSAEGDSVFTFYEKYPLPGTVAFDSERGLANLAPFKGNFYSDVPVEKHDYWASFLTEVPIEWYTQPVTHATWKDVSTSWIYTELDEVVTYDVQQRMIQVAEESHGARIKTYTLNAGHSPFLSMPDKLAIVVRDIYKENKL